MRAIEHRIYLLKQLDAFNALTEKQLAVVAGQVELVELDKKTSLFKVGDNDPCDYFLIEGKIKLTAEDDRAHDLTVDKPESKRPIANLRPRHYHAVTLEKSLLLKISHDLLSYVIEQGKSYKAQTRTLNFGHADLTPKMVLHEIKEAIAHGELKIPSLPNVAIKVQQVANKDETTTEELVKTIMLDPSITAKLIQAANSPLFRGVAAVETCTDAVVRLGRQTIQQLVTIFALKEVFNCDDPKLNKRYHEIWSESVNVASIAAVLAKQSKLNYSPEKAILCGLLHRIGELVIYAFTNEYQGFLKLDQVIESIIDEYQNKVACDVIEQWKMGDVYYQCMKYLRHWQKEQVMDPDYSDLLNVALLHEYLHQHKLNGLPHFNKLDAFKRLQLGEVTPELTIKVLKDHEQDIRDLKSLLKAS